MPVFKINFHFIVYGRLSIAGRRPALTFMLPEARHSCRASRLGGIGEKLSPLHFLEVLPPAGAITMAAAMLKDF
jgi:hypothetical protein